MGLWAKTIIIIAMAALRGGNWKSSVLRVDYGGSEELNHRNLLRLILSCKADTAQLNAKIMKATLFVIPLDVGKKIKYFTNVIQSLPEKYHFFL